MTIKDGVADSVFDKRFWEELAPKFTIGEKLDNYVFPLDEKSSEACNSKMHKEGYVHLRQPGLKADLPALADLFDTIIDDTGLPAVFSFVYDTPWDIVKQTRNLMTATLHDDYVSLPDVWAWRVQAGESGWRPHRDMPHGDGGVFKDLRPKSLNVWVPITEASPITSCMYIVPRPHDNKYAIPQEGTFSGRFPDVRALPAKAGDVLSWTMRAFHWGSRAADDHGQRPRMSLAFTFQRSDVDAYNEFWLDPQKAPDFETRLYIIAMQIMQYRHMYDFTDDLVSLAETIMQKIPPPKSYLPSYSEAA